MYKSNNTTSKNPLNQNSTIQNLNLNLKLKSGKFKREQEYPSLVDQLDLIYHSGIDAWKAKIKETKDKYPKP